MSGATAHGSSSAREIEAGNHRSAQSFPKADHSSKRSLLKILSKGFLVAGVILLVKFQ
jgi:hypothetical protein